MFKCIYVCMFKCIYVCFNVCMFVWMYLCVFKCMYVFFGFYERFAIVLVEWRFYSVFGIPVRVSEILNWNAYRILQLKLTHFLCFSINIILTQYTTLSISLNTKLTLANHPNLNITLTLTPTQHQPNPNPNVNPDKP